jgi:hemerythrin superfamily protein
VISRRRARESSCPEGGATVVPAMRVGGNDLAYKPSREVHQMDAMSLLKRQHKEVKGLFKKIEKASRANERRQLLDQIATALEGHTTIEEEMFYPAVRELGTKKGEEMVNEAFEEHHVVKLVLAELPKVDVEDERFEAKMTVLSELVEHHVEEEEKEMFKLAKRIGEDELDELGERMMERFEQLSARGPQRRAA